MSALSHHRGSLKRPMSPVASETKRARKDWRSCELESLKAELEHERSLRSLDAKRFLQTQQRLKQSCEFAMEEAKEAKALMEETKEANEKHLEQLKRAMAMTKEELLEVQEDLDYERSQRVKHPADPRINRLQDDLEAKEIENEQLNETIDQLRNDLKGFLDDSKKPVPSQKESLSEARPEVLQELNRLRIKLAESERKNRQYKRLAEDGQRKAKQLLQEKEQNRSLKLTIEKLEQQSRESLKAEEVVSEKLLQWQDLGKLMIPGDAPEPKVLRRFWNDTLAKAKESQTAQATLQSNLERASDTIQGLQTETASFARKEASWEQERLEHQKRQSIYEKDIKVLRGQEDIYKREVESLRSIVQTFDELPLKASQGGGITSQPPANLRAIEVSLKAAKEEVELLKTARDGLQESLQSLKIEKEELQAKHSTVMDKFGKLRDALYAERAKAEKAVERANEAEILAGKGSFHPEHTKVVHLGTNPLTMALREEIGVLKKQIEVLSNQNSSSGGKTYISDVDPNKLHQRLKQSFKEQISRFREGVYLMTGYKVDMIPDNDRYKFKVRSVFAERERDHLVFQWPEGDEVTSLDLLNTEHAKLLTRTPSYEYMTKFHSLPAFLASVQLSLFEKQTMM